MCKGASSVWMSVRHVHTCFLKFHWFFTGRLRTLWGCSANEGALHRTQILLMTLLEVLNNVAWLLSFDLVIKLVINNLPASCCFFDNQLN
jgi:hypothetical protein